MPSRRLKTVRRTLADGTVKTYTYDLSKRRRDTAKTVARLLEQYKESREFKSLRPNSKTTYLHCMDLIEPLRDYLVADLKKTDIVRIKDAFADTPAQANNVVKFLRTLFEWSIERGWRDWNPARGIKLYKIGEHRRWTDDEIAYALDHFPEPLRRATILALYTGQRESDCIAMRWSAFDGNGVLVKQEKTGKELWVPCDSFLKAELNAWKEQATALTILTTSRGRPWRLGSFRTAFSKTVSQHAFVSGCVYHGLRKCAAAMLAEAGCTTKEISAITGQSAQMVEHYTRQADQRHLALAAVAKLENARGKRRNKPA